GASPTSISVYFDGRSAGNGSYRFSNDMNGDGASNDLIYVPRNTSEMNFVTLNAGTAPCPGPTCVVYTPAQQAAAWDAFINQDPYRRKRRGGHAQRTAVSPPMASRPDACTSQAFGPT